MAVVALLILFRTFRQVEARSVEVLLRSTGPMVALSMLTYLLPIVSDTLGWQSLLARLADRPTLGKLLAVRLSLDAVQMTLPGGSVLSEALTPRLLKARCAILGSDALASMAARKCLFGLTQAVFLIVAVACGRESLERVSRQTGLPWLLSAFVGCAVVLAVAAVGAAWLLGTRDMGEAVRRCLGALPWDTTRASACAQQPKFTRFDAGAARLFGVGSLATVAPAVGLLWFLQAVDTWFLLRLLGVPITFRAALPIEAAVSIVRMAGIAIPGGLGVQEAGYVAFFQGVGVPNAAIIGAAFAVIKRSREALWALVGYSLLLQSQISLRARVGVPELATVVSDDSV
jgi:uncharacterized membrane protein YbhN (UPF0104 family)